MKLSLSESGSESRSLSGFSYRNAGETGTYRDAAALAANRARTTEWAKARVEGGVAAVAAPLPSPSPKVERRDKWMSVTARSQVETRERTTMGSHVGIGALALGPRFGGGGALRTASGPRT